MNCPNCGAENANDKFVCDKCHSRLPQSNQSAAPTGRPLGGPLVGGPADVQDEPRSVVGQPLGGQNPSGPPMPPPGGPSYGQQQGPPRMHYVAREEPRHRGPSFNFFNFLYSLVVAVVVFGGGGYLFYNFYYLPKGPTDTARKFIQAIATQNAQSLDATLSAASRKRFESLSEDDRKGVYNFFGSLSQGFEEGREFDLQFGKVEGKWAKVLVKPGPMPLDSFKDETLPAAYKEGVPIALVKEGDEWKVELITMYQSREKAGYKVGPN